MRLAVVFSLLALVSGAYAADYTYVARTAETVRVSGSVRVGSFVWSCRDKYCKIKGPWFEPSVEACQMLAQKVGRITHFGHSVRYLNRAQLAECNSADASASRTIDVPPVSAPVDNVVKTPNVKLPPPVVGGKKLNSFLGPQIQQFEASEGCRYSGRGNSLGFSYRVIAAPDGAAVAIVEILQVLANGDTRAVFVSPDDHRSVQASATRIVDQGADSDVVRYMLRATDVRRRQSTKLLSNPYWAGQPAFRIGPRFTVRREGAAFVYMVPYTMQNVAPGSAPEASITFRGSSSPIHAEIVGDGSISVIARDGYEGWTTSYGRHFYTEARGNISFRTYQAVWPDGSLELPGFHSSVVNAIDDWRIGIRIPRASSAGCDAPGVVWANLEGDVDRPPPATLAEEFTGYQWRINCGCGEPYDTDITRTRAFTSVIQACMANTRGSALMCGMSAPLLIPTGAAGRRCTFGGTASRVDTGPPSCHPVPGSIRILENNR